MTTVAEAHALIKARLVANFSAIALRFKGDDTLMPDVPIAHAYVELILDGYSYVGFGGGRGGNLQRTTGRIEAQVLQPTGSGASGNEDGMEWAEAICAVFRGERFDAISYFAAEAFPVGGRTEDGTYDHIATAIVDLSFDKTA